MFPDTPTPPQPIHTRWGTWIDAAVYFATHFEKISQFLEKYDPDEAQSIADAKEATSKLNIKKDLAFIKSNFACLSVAIIKIQAKGALCRDAIEIFDSIRPNLEALSKRKEFADKFNNVCNKNTGLKILRKISQVINGEKDVSHEYVDKLTPLELEAFKHAPVVSCDVERTFSHYKRVLEDSRRSFIFENLKSHVVIHCNKFD